MSRALNILGFIPARAGSVGVPGKNVRMLCGRPVISYTVDAAIESKLLSSYVVSSDDVNIERFCADQNVKFIKRPQELAQSSSRIDDAIRHGISIIEPEIGKVDYIVLLYANIPVRPANVIDDAVQLMIDTGADSVHSIADIGKFHPYWLFQKDEAGKVSKYIPNNIFRRQELPELFAIDGAVCVLNRDIVMAAEGSENPHAFWGQDVRGLTLAPHDTIDIDSVRDFLLAESVIKHKTEKVAADKSM